MRILHSADWHLGRIFYGLHLIEDQAEVIHNTVLPMLSKEKVDLFILAGDVYDRSQPPTEAVALWEEVLAHLTKTGMSALIIGGNHDSGIRLSVARDALEEVGIYVYGTVEQAMKPLILKDTYGPIAFCPFPYAEAREILLALRQVGYDIESLEDQSLNAAYGAWIDHVCKQIPEGMRTVAVAHAFLAGGLECESERSLSVGGSAALAPDLFQHFDYVALGHLHGPQQAGAPHIRYSGSLLSYSFDEAAQTKGINLVDIGSEGLLSCESRPTVEPHGVAIIKGSFEDLVGDRDKQKDCAHQYVQAELTDKEAIPDAMARLRRYYPHILSLSLVGRKGAVVDELVGPKLKTMSRESLFADFVEQVRQQGLSPEEKEFMEEIWEELRRKEVDE